jgi:hypothetical protein
MIPDGVLIARAQFAFAIGYHIPVSGLCSALQRDVVGCVVISSDRDHCNPADDPRLSRLRALGFPRQDEPGQRIRMLSEAGRSQSRGKP